MAPICGMNSPTSTCAPVIGLPEASFTTSRIGFIPVFAVLGSRTSTEIDWVAPGAPAGACEGAPIPANAPFKRLSESTMKLAPVTTLSPDFKPS